MISGIAAENAFHHSLLPINGEIVPDRQELIFAILFRPDILCTEKTAVFQTGRQCKDLMKNRETLCINPLRKVVFIFLMVLAIWLSPCLLQAQDAFPPVRGTVNDFAGVISAADAARIEGLSREVLEKTGASVIVATFPSIGDNDLNDYVNRLYQLWGIGKKGEDRGVLIVLALQERKIRIETGYGLEGILPDGRVGGILDQNVIPYLKKREYGPGLLSAATAVSLVIAEEAGVTLTGSPAARQTSSRQVRQRSSYGFLILLLLIFLLLLGTRRGREYLPLILMMLLSGSGRRGSGGGDFDGFGSFGGGFGGFGGGSSGGGGASRDF